MSNIDKLLDIMAQLRDPESGCPWDIKQSFASVAPYTIEEAYEVADAIKRGDMDELRDELGDLLLNVVFHVQMAREAGLFDFQHVVDAICDKMVRRHPHVFESRAHANDADLHRAWEAQKADERQAKNTDNTSALAGVALALPALMRAQKLGKRAARVGFDWTNVAAVNEKIREELRECEEALNESHERMEEELGDLLYAVVNLARHTNIDAEQALCKANDKFQKRFEVVEALTKADGCLLTDCDEKALDHYWELAKKQIAETRNR